MTISLSPLPTPGIRKLLMILGVPIDNLTMDETLDRLESFVTIGRKTGKIHQVATVNTDFLINSLSDAKLRHVLQMADMCTADGMPLVWGSRLLGTPLKERVTGSDMVPAIASRAAEKGLSLYLMGAAPGVAARAAEILQAENPGLTIVGVSSPYWKPGQEMDPAALEEIKAARPDILLVAFGNPKQEMWIQQYGPEVGVPVMLGIGASLDFIVGTCRRAPIWMQKSGLEWLGRLMQEPGRLWRRYAGNLVKFGPLIARQWWVMARNQTHDTSLGSIETRIIGRTVILSIKGVLDVHQSNKLHQQTQVALAQASNLVIDMAQVERIDYAIIGTLIDINKQATEMGSGMRLVGVPDRIGRILTLLKIPLPRVSYSTKQFSTNGASSFSSAVPIPLHSQAPTKS